MIEMRGVSKTYRVRRREAGLHEILPGVLKAMKVPNAFRWSDRAGAISEKERRK